MNDIHPCCLTIAGSDSGGNAGVQADLRAFHAYSLHGCTVFTALTAQNPDCVFATEKLQADFVAAQLDAVLGVYNIAALKTGMLGSADAVEVLSDRIARHDAIAKVVDPVMVATSGARLADDATRAAAERLLFPLATVITPNIPEIEVLSNRTVKSLHDACDAAKCLYDKFGAAVLVKGGHAVGGSGADDILFDGSGHCVYSLPRIANPVSTHGTGCALSAAIAAELALGRSLAQAVRGAKEYVHRSISESYLAGKNCGVLR